MCLICDFIVCVRAWRRLRAGQTFPVVSASWGMSCANTKGHDISSLPGILSLFPSFVFSEYPLQILLAWSWCHAYSYLKNQSPPECQVNGSNSVWHDTKCSNFFSEKLEILVKKIFWQSGLSQCGLISFLWSGFRMWVLCFMNWLACIWFLKDFQRVRVNKLIWFELRSFLFLFSGLWLSCIVLFLSRACVYYVRHI